MRINTDLYRAGRVFNDKREVSAKAYRVGLDMIEEIETLRSALGQACMNLATIRPLDVMEPGEDLSLGECKERWVGLVLEQIALAA